MEKKDGFFNVFFGISKNMIMGDAAMAEKISNHVLAD